MSLRENKCIIHAIESGIVPSQLINVVSGTPGTSCFINDRRRNLFFKRLEIRSVSTKLV